MFTESQVIQLRESLNNKGYCQVNNILHPQLREYLQIGSALLERQAEYECSIKQSLVTTQTKNSKSLYGSDLGEILLLFFTELYSKISNKNLIPTYSYYRNYTKTNKLIAHQDRPSCQYSATIQIDSSSNKSWDFYLIDKQGQNVKCQTNLGDIIFYKGEEVKHWRKELPYKYSSHIFLHWVDKDNPQYNEHWFDGRDGLGVLR